MASARSKPSAAYQRELSYALEDLKPEALRAVALDQLAHEIGHLCETKE